MGLWQRLCRDVGEGVHVSLFIDDDDDDGGGGGDDDDGDVAQKKF